MGRTYTIWILVGLLSGCSHEKAIDSSQQIDLGIRFLATALFWQLMFPSKCSAEDIRTSGKMRISAAALPAVCALCLIGVCLIKHFGESSLNHELRVLRPAVGARLPVVDDVPPESRLAHGEWQLLLVNADCNDCHDVLEDMSHVGNEFPRRQNAIILNISRKQLANPIPKGLAVVECNHRWQAEVPQSIKIRDGTVLSVSKDVFPTWSLMQ